MTALLGCVGGVCAYFFGKWATRLANAHRIRQSLSPEIRQRLAPFFPELDLTRIVIKDHANLPPNWLPFLEDAAGIAFGQRVYMLHTYNDSDPRFLRLLIHELVHIEQVRRLGGELRFACAYGQGYLAAKGYWHNPLEVEARRITAEVDKLLR